MLVHFSRSGRASFALSLSLPHFDLHCHHNCLFPRSPRIRPRSKSIFVGSEDIRKQLPTESSLFDRVNADWISTTKRMHAAGTAYKACNLEGVLELLQTMDDTLDKIQKSLDEYLETKRQAFPRFYFISNDGGKGDRGPRARFCGRDIHFEPRHPL